MKKRWTKREDNVVLKAVKYYPNNLTQAFKKASETLGRTEGACMNRWYTYISKQTGKNNIALMCVSGKTYGVNRKNCKTHFKKQKKSMFSRLWKQLITFFG